MDSVRIWTRLLVLSTLMLAALSLPNAALKAAEKTKKTEQNNDFNPQLDDVVPADRYLTNEEMVTWLRSIARRHPKIARAFSIGKSEQGRELLVLELSHSIERGGRDLLMPMVKLIGNIHGNEAVGRQLLLRTISHFIRKDNVDPSVTRLLNTTDILFLPSMNPDDFVLAKEGDCTDDDDRGNATTKVDLNLNFPSNNQFQQPINKGVVSFERISVFQRGRAPETQSVIKWILDNPFVLSASLHGGGVAASYPWLFSGTDSATTNFYQASPDDKVFRKLAQDYANRHPSMKRLFPCPSAGYKDGLTSSGSANSSSRGMMQDFNYVYSNAFEFTLQLSCCKYAPAMELPTEWQYNRKPLLNFIASTHLGLVVDKDTKGPIKNAYVHVFGIEKNITTTERGEYWRLLAPGKYTIQSFAEGYVPSSSQNIEITDIYTEQLNFELDRKVHEKTILTHLRCD